MTRGESLVPDSRHLLAIAVAFETSNPYLACVVCDLLPTQAITAHMPGPLVPQWHTYRPTDST